MIVLRSVVGSQWIGAGNWRRMEAGSATRIPLHYGLTNFRST